MHENNQQSDGKSIDLTIKLILIIILLAWCVMIILPFLIPVLWGVILAITLFPIFNRLMKVLKGRKALSSALITLILLALLIAPSVWLISSVVEGTRQFVVSLRDHTLVIPPPDPGVENWPIIGKPIYNTWQMLVTNLEAALLQHRDQILQVGDKFLGAVKSVASNFLMMILSIIISGILLFHTEKTEKSTLQVASRLTGQKGEVLKDMVVLTIRNVAKGILGVAFIQFILMGASFMIAQIPFAGLWALLVLLLAIVQLPVGIVAIPVVIYLYSVREPFPATLWSLLIILLSLVDNILKPWLMGKGAPVPTLVIFLGAIGGMIMSGFIGLFTGAIILSLGYKLMTFWLGGSKENQQPETPA